MTRPASLATGGLGAGWLLAPFPPLWKGTGVRVCRELRSQTRGGQGRSRACHMPPLLPWASKQVWGSPALAAAPAAAHPQNSSSSSSSSRWQHSNPSSGHRVSWGFKAGLAAGGLLDEKLSPQLSNTATADETAVLVAMICGWSCGCQVWHAAKPRWHNQAHASQH